MVGITVAHKKRSSRWGFFCVALLLLGLSTAGFARPNLTPAAMLTALSGQSLERAPSCVYRRHCTVIRPFLASFAGKRNPIRGTAQITRMRVYDVVSGDRVKFAPGCRGQPKGWHPVLGTSWEVKPHHMLCNSDYGTVVLVVQVSGPPGVLGRIKVYLFSVKTGTIILSDSGCEYEFWIKPPYPCPDACGEYDGTVAHEKPCTR
jgi:hypothetical protein